MLPRRVAAAPARAARAVPAARATHAVPAVPAASASSPSLRPSLRLGQDAPGAGSCDDFHAAAARLHTPRRRHLTGS